MSYDPYATDDQNSAAPSDERPEYTYGPGPVTEPTSGQTPSPYSQPSGQPYSSPQPYAAPQPYTQPAQPYTQPAQPFGQPTQPYSQPYADPAQAYGAPVGPYGAQPQAYGIAPYGQPGQVTSYPVSPGYGRPLIDDPNGPDAPLRGATFLEAVKRYWLRGVTFTGRASRSEYLWASLMNVAVFAGLGALGGMSDGGPLSSMLALLMVLFMLASIVPGIALTIRRLHDTNTQGTFFLLSLIPYIGSFVVMIMCLMPEKPEGARFDKINGAG